jgi:hypothetical protein
MLLVLRNSLLGIVIVLAVFPLMLIEKILHFDSCFVNNLFGCCEDLEVKILNLVTSKAEQLSARGA